MPRKISYYEFDAAGQALSASIQKVANSISVQVATVAGGEVTAFWDDIIDATEDAVDWVTDGAEQLVDDGWDLVTNLDADDVGNIVTLLDAIAGDGEGLANLATDLVDNIFDLADNIGFSAAEGASAGTAVLTGAAADQLVEARRKALKQRNRDIRSAIVSRKRDLRDAVLQARARSRE